ncbi:MAG: DUF362 domain-containing protein [Endomicrobium sp.]|jgi:uncharacterized protein (DUF362 family)/Pyruvate/2-oxoacid:ferredoxin oxidoreductase delta subunit|nr:DUF362 domain-containing protein [Endomicrobium sp.]
MTKISLLKRADYNMAENAVKEAVDLLGGISSFVKPGEKILIKPNLLSPKTPDKAVTTHPEIVRGIIRLVKSAGAVAVVGDSPGGVYSEDINNLWEVTGIADVCKEENAELVSFEAAGSREIDINDANIKKALFSKIVLDCDGIINLPKLKTHTLMTFTAGIKNFYGVIPGLRKVEYHKLASKNEDFARLLANIYLFLKNKIRFTLIDGILAMEGNGPSSGKIRKMDMVAACADTLMLDAFLFDILGGNKTAKNHVLEVFGITSEDLKHLTIIGDLPGNFNLDNFTFPQARKLDIVPKPIVKILGKFLWVKPIINAAKCIGCMSCAKSCPVQAIEKKDKEKRPSVIYEKCITCFCCHELCPYKAIDFKKSMLVKLFMQ